MEASNLRDIQIFFAAGMFLLGMATFIIGVAVLVIRTWGNDVHVLAAQTTRLVQKGIAEDVAGLVGNASSLLNAINEMVHTATGIGVFLILTGVILMGLTCWIVFQVA